MEAWSRLAALAHTTNNKAVSRSRGLTTTGPLMEAASGLHAPAELTHANAKHQARKRRASIRPLVGCCEELGGAEPTISKLRFDDR